MVSSRIGERQVSRWSSPSLQEALTDRSREPPSFARQSRPAAASLDLPVERQNVGTLEKRSAFQYRLDRVLLKLPTRPLHDDRSQIELASLEALLTVRWPLNRVLNQSSRQPFKETSTLAMHSATNCVASPLRVQPAAGIIPTTSPFSFRSTTIRRRDTLPDAKAQEPRCSPGPAHLGASAASAVA